MILLEKLCVCFGGIGCIVFYILLLLLGVVCVGVYEDYFQVICMDNVYFFKQLMQCGMGFNLIEFKCGYIGLMLVICEDLMKVFDVLVNVFDVNLEVQVINGDMLLMLVFFYGNILVVKLLLVCEVEVNCFGWIVLYYVVINGSFEIVKLLLDVLVYVDVEFFDDKMMFVMLVVMCGCVVVVEVLCDNGVDFMFKNKDGLIVMDLVCCYGQEGVIDVFNVKLCQ